MSSLSATVSPPYLAAQMRLLSSRILLRAVSSNFSKCREGAALPLPFDNLLSMQQKDQGDRYSRAGLIMASSLKESPANNPGLCETADEATKGYFLQQTMYRIKDPKISLDFYSRILGMMLLKRFDFPEMKFSLYFMGYENMDDAPQDEAERTLWTFKSKATLELTHNWGTESDPDFKGYHNGNIEPRGYGHIGITVDDLHKACERFEKLGVDFVKRPNDGKMKNVAFIKDPDGYWIELFDLKTIAQATSSGSTA